MPREKKYATRAEQQAAYRERQKAADQSGTPAALIEPEPEPSDQGSREAKRPPQVRADLPEAPDGNREPKNEIVFAQGTGNFLFSGSSKPGQVKEDYYPDKQLAEGQRPQPAAGRLNPYEGELPPDIAAVWGHGKLDGSGSPAEVTARLLIGAWGIDRFRRSALHSLAMQEAGREEKMNPIRNAFVASRSKS